MTNPIQDNLRDDLIHWLATNDANVEKHCSNSVSDTIDEIIDIFKHNGYVQVRKGDINY